MSDALRPPSVLLIGGPNTGKSHFAFQLYGRLRAQDCTLRLRQTPESVNLFTEGLACLNSGKAAQHTATGAYIECMLPLSLPDGSSLDLCWPDYGGEQLYQQIKARTIDEQWQRRLLAADGWLLFIRLSLVQLRKDWITSPLSFDLPIAGSDIEQQRQKEPQGSDSPQLQRNATQSQEDADLSEQVLLIELLQMLLYAGHVDLTERGRRPALGVVLSCWDELNVDSAAVPAAVLNDRAPLIAQFIDSHWAPDSYFIMGSSSTERELSKTTPDQEFLQRGPEHFGYSVNMDGRRDRDFTLPIVNLLSRLAINEG
ncbi:MAG TPA: hypothetical protein VHC22_01865 [Pirellulales bacterium]|nr:hypothetical protein [Pirellulales bacterium]